MWPSSVTRPVVGLGQKLSHRTYPPCKLHWGNGGLELVEVANQ